MTEENKRDFLGEALKNANDSIGRPETSTIMAGDPESTDVGQFDGVDPKLAKRFPQDMSDWPDEIAVVVEVPSQDSIDLVSELQDPIDRHPDALQLHPVQPNEGYPRSSPQTNRGIVDGVLGEEIKPIRNGRYVRRVTGNQLVDSQVHEVAAMIELGGQPWAVLITPVRSYEERKDAYDKKTGRFADVFELADDPEGSDLGYRAILAVPEDTLVLTETQYETIHRSHGRISVPEPFMLAGNWEYLSREERNDLAKEWDDVRRSEQAAESSSDE